jgi:PAS domain S-box-containing protein
VGLCAWLGLRAWAARERQAVVAWWSARLSATADDRRGVVESWVVERLADAQTIARHPTGIFLASGRHAGPYPLPAEVGARDHIQEVLQAHVEGAGYQGAWLLGAASDLPVIASTGPEPEAPGRDLARRVLASGTPRADLHRLTLGVSVDVAAPARPAGKPSGTPVGVVLLSMNPDSSLYRLLLSEPVPTRTGETLLVARDGLDVVFLSPLRHNPAPPLRLRRPFSESGLAAASALEGVEAFGAFVDYRGVPVFAATRRIRSTGWGLVVKVDQEEALEDYRANVRRTATAFAGLVLAVLALGFGLRHRHVASAGLALARSEARYRLLLEQAGDAVLFFGADGRISGANRRVERLYGYTRDELLASRIGDLHVEELRPLVSAQMEEMRAEPGKVFETTHRSRDGTPIAVEVSGCFVEADGEGTFLYIVRDVRERKAADERIAFLNRMLRTLFEVNQLMIREPEEERLLAEACRILVEHGGFRMAWVGLLDPDSAWVVPAAWAGHEEGYLFETKVIADAGPFGLGPMGSSIREGRTGTIADVRDAEGFEPWREAALRRGYRAVASSPIRLRGEIAGALALYASQPGLFEGEVLQLIEELGADLGFALESIDARREREKAAEALRHSKAFLETLINAAPVAVYTLRPDGRVGEIWNEAAERMFGWSRQEVVCGPLPIVPSEQQEESRTLRDRVLGGESYSNLEVTRRRRDGTPIELSTAAAPIRDAVGRVAQILSVVADVTDRKRAEAALRESEARFKRLAENAPDVIYRYRLAPTAAMEYVNPAIQRISGYGPEEYYADPELIWRIVHPDDRHILERAIRGEMETGAIELVRWLRRDGTVLWTEIRNVVVRDEQARAVALEGIARDVTERVAAEQTVRKLSAAVEQSPAAVVITDTASQIEYVNPAFSRLTGYTLDEVKGQNPRILKSGTHPRKFYQQLYAAITAGAEWRGEMLNRKKDGELFWEYASISAIVDAQGRPTHFLAVKENITERKKAEEQLRQTQEQLLQSQKLEAVGRLAGGVAHDFNNLLGVIIGHGELAQAAVPPPHPARARLEQILGAALRAADLTRQLLAFSRRQVLQPQVLNLNSVVNDTEKMLRRLIGEDIDLVSRLAPDLGHVKVDPGQIAQVLMNLAVNARDAMPEGGVLTLETADVELDQEYARTHVPLPPGPYVQLRVKDTGVGMDEAVRQHIFEPFFTTKPEGVGTGLGLSTVYGIVKQSGGYIWADSMPGGGTTFTLQLPRVSEPEAPRPEPPAVEARAKGAETILVVEDQANLRELICEVLEDNGYSVLGAKEAPAALALAEAHAGQIDLLLTDVVMPGMSGHELAGQLVSRNPAMRVLYMSGYTSDIVTGHGVLEKGLHLLEKPFTSLALTRRVRQVLDESRD